MVVIWGYLYLPLLLLVWMLKKQRKKNEALVRVSINLSWKQNEIADEMRQEWVGEEKGKLPWGWRVQKQPRQPREHGFAFPARQEWVSDALFLFLDTQPEGRLRLNSAHFYIIKSHFKMAQK